MPSCVAFYKKYSTDLAFYRLVQAIANHRPFIGFDTVSKMNADDRPYKGVHGSDSFITFTIPSSERHAFRDPGLLELIPTQMSSAEAWSFVTKYGRDGAREKRIN
jgi:hypothetical protein